MTPEEFIKKLQDLKQGAENAVIKQLPPIEKLAYALVVDFIDSNLDTKGGSLVANDQTSAALNGFTDLYISALTDLADYKGMVAKYLKNFKPLTQILNDYHDSQGLDPVKANVGAVQEVVIGEIIDRYTENGLNRGFVQPLRELLFNNVSGGLNKKQALKQVEDFIVSGKDQSGKLAQYVEQTAQQGVDSYEGATNARIMQVYDINTLIMSGSLIKTSSPQCVYCINTLGGIIDRTDWSEVHDLAVENGLIEGTTFDNVTFNKLHWGCRHSFTPAVIPK